MPSASSVPQIELRGVSVTFPGGVQALRGVDLAVRRGEFVAIVGLSGAGKSTLLRTVNRLVEPTAGRVFFEGEDLTAAPPARLLQVRAQIGMIFQTFNLVMRDLRRINREDGITVLVSLHFVDLARTYADRIVGLRGGELVFDGPTTSVDEATFRQIYGRSLRAEDFRDAGG